MIKKILFSQPSPATAHNPYTRLEEQFGVKCDFYQFIHIEGLTAKEFRQQRINPLDYLLVDNAEFVDNARALASSLVVRDDPSSFFYNEAETFLFQLIVSVCVKYPIGSPLRNIETVRTLLTFAPFDDADGSLLDWVELLLQDKTIPNYLKTIPEELRAYLIRNKNQPAAAFNNTYSFCLQATEFVTNPSVADSLTTSNMDLMQLKTNPQTLYLVLDLQRLTFNSAVYKPFIRFIVTTVMLGASVRVGSANKPKDRVLFLLDEIAQLGNLQYLPNMLSIYAGMGITVWTIWQDIAQIKKNYDKEWSSIVNNSGVQQYFGFNDNETAEDVSKKVGKTTVYKKTLSENDAKTISRTEADNEGYNITRGTSNTRGTNSGYSYQGFNYTSSGGTNKSTTDNETYTTSYNFSESIQVGWSKTRGESVTQEVIDLITPFELMTTQNEEIDAQLVFYLKKSKYPILCGKVKYYSDMEFANEHSENLTLERNKLK